MQIPASLEWDENFVCACKSHCQPGRRTLQGHDDSRSRPIGIAINVGISIASGPSCGHIPKAHGVVTDGESVDLQDTPAGRWSQTESGCVSRRVAHTSPILSANDARKQSPFGRETGGDLDHFRVRRLMMMPQNRQRKSDTCLPARRRSTSLPGVRCSILWHCA